MGSFAGIRKVNCTEIGCALDSKITTMDHNQNVGGTTDLQFGRGNEGLLPFDYFKRFSKERKHQIGGAETRSNSLTRPEERASSSDSVLGTAISASESHSLPAKRKSVKSKKRIIKPKKITKTKPKKIKSKKAKNLAKPRCRPCQKKKKPKKKCKPCKTNKRKWK